MSAFCRVLFFLFAPTLAGCMSLIDGPDRLPSASELIGVYDYGHAGFAETLELHSDGSYKRTLAAHLGQDSASFTGSWHLVEKRIEFKPDPDQPVDSAPEPAEPFFHRHRPAFAPLRYVKSGKVDDWFVYLPRRSR